MSNLNFKPGFLNEEISKLAFNMNPLLKNRMGTGAVLGGMGGALTGYASTPDQGNFGLGLNNGRLEFGASQPSTLKNTIMGGLMGAGAGAMFGAGHHMNVGGKLLSKGTEEVAAKAEGAAAKAEGAAAKAEGAAAKAPPKPAASLPKAPQDIRESKKAKNWEHQDANNPELLNPEGDARVRQKVMDARRAANPQPAAPQPAQPAPQPAQAAPQKPPVVQPAQQGAASPVILERLKQMGVQATPENIQRYGPDIMHEHLGITPNTYQPTSQPIFKDASLKVAMLKLLHADISKSASIKLICNLPVRRPQ